MNFTSKLASATAMALILSASLVSAQGALVGTDALNDRIDDIQESVADDFAESEDSERHGSNQYAQGWTGSFAASLAATSGNTDTGDAAIGARLRYGAGLWNHTLGLGYEYGSSDDTVNSESAFFVYDANRYFSDSFYMFGMGSVTYDNFATNKYDAFLGFGPGYRILNSDKVSWRVQAGPGVRYVEEQNGFDTTEAAGMASSRFYYKFTETMFLTNDTDYLYSDINAVTTNDLAINFKMTDALATRFSYRTDYNSNPLPGLDAWDNRLGIAVVYGF